MPQRPIVDRQRNLIPKCRCRGPAKFRLYVPAAPRTSTYPGGGDAEILAADLLIGRKLLGTAGVNDLSLVHNERARHAQRKREVLLDERSRSPRHSDGGSCRRPLRRSRAQALGRLVHQDQLGVLHERARDRQHLLLAAGERAAAPLRRSSSRGKSRMTRSISMARAGHEGGQRRFFRRSASERCDALAAPSRRRRG